MWGFCVSSFAASDCMEKRFVALAKCGEKPRKTNKTRNKGKITKKKNKVLGHRTQKERKTKIKIEVKHNKNNKMKEIACQIHIMYLIYITNTHTHIHQTEKINFFSVLLLYVYKSTQQKWCRVAFQIKKNCVNSVAVVTADGTPTIGIFEIENQAKWRTKRK